MPALSLRLFIFRGSGQSISWYTNLSGNFAKRSGRSRQKAKTNRFTSPASVGVRSSSLFWLSPLLVEAFFGGSATARAHSGGFVVRSLSSSSPSNFAPEYPSACNRASKMTNSGQSPPHVVVDFTLESNSSTAASTLTPVDAFTAPFALRSSSSSSKSIPSISSPSSSSAIAFVRMPSPRSPPAAAANPRRAFALAPSFTPLQIDPGDARDRPSTFSDRFPLAIDRLKRAATRCLELAADW